MKTSITAFALFITLVLLVAESSYQQGFSNVSGAPAGRTGSPFDSGGIACNASGCHTSFPLGSRPGWITSNIPGTGYVPGQTYTITASAISSASCIRFGFEISAQTASGTTAGTAIITNATTTKFALTTSTRWVTHTLTGSSASATPGTKIWSYNWTAPASGTGTVTFYGAFNRANNSNSVIGDSIFLSQLVAPQSTTGILEAGDDSWFSVYPVPALNNIFIHLNLDNNSPHQIELADIAGKIIRTVADNTMSSSQGNTIEINTAGINPGIYFIRLFHDSTVTVKKIIIL